MDRWIVERVEATGGPSSFLNGSGAVGGMLKDITKTADRSGDISRLYLAQAAVSLQRDLKAPGAEGQVLLNGA